MVSKTARHALAATAVLARNRAGMWSGAAEIATEIGAPPNYLGKLLKTLADVGVLVSQKGKGGGFRLARHADDVSLLEIVEPIDHVSRSAGCLLGRSICSDDSPCPAHARWKEVRDVYMTFLRETSVADLAHQPDLATRL